MTSPYMGVYIHCCLRACLPRDRPATGDTVNTASRMESTSSIGRAQVSAGTYQELKDLFAFQPNGLQECKGLGLIETYLLGARLNTGS